MPDAWPVLSLREGGVDLLDCLHQTPPAAPDGLPYVGIPQIKDGRIDLRSARRISEKHFFQWTEKVDPRPGDIVLSRRCNPGETALVEEGMRLALGQNLLLLRANGGKINPAYLRWAVRSPAWWEQVNKFINVGAVFDSLRISDIPRFEIPVPPPKAQRAISEILDLLDGKIELNRRMSETLEAMARANFRSWFVHPVSNEAFQSAWRMGTVSELCQSIYSGGTPSTRNPAFWNGTLPWLSSGETRDHFITVTEKRITPAAVDGSSTRLAPAYATVIASAGQGNTRGQTAILGIDSYVNQSVVTLVANPGTSSALHLYFNLESRYEEFRRVSDAHSSRGSLTTKVIAALPAAIPPRELVDSFDAHVQPMVARIFLSMRESRTLAALRDTLLPKLISGELRIKEADRFVAAAV